MTTAPSVPSRSLPPFFRDHQLKDVLAIPDSVMTAGGATALRLLQQGALEKADILLKGLLAVSPRDVDLLALAALHARQSGDLRAALVHLEAALAIAPARADLAAMRNELHQFLLAFAQAAAKRAACV